MRSPFALAPDPARLCALNAGIQLVWGAILALSLQSRSLALGGSNGVRDYAAIAASGALLATIVQLVAGRLSDRVRARGGNRRGFYAWGIGLAVPALVWFYLAADFGQLLAAFLALEVAMNVASGPYQAVIPDFVERTKRGAASAWMASYQSVGNAAGLVIAGFVADLRIVALALAAPLAGTYWLTVTHARALRPNVDDGATLAPGAGSLSLRGPLLALLVSRGLINLGFFTLLGFLLFFVRDSLGIGGAATTTRTAVLFLGFTLAAVAGAAAAAKPADRYDKRVVVTVAIAAILGALAALAAAPSFGIACAAALLAGAAWGAFVTADWALATALLPPSAMATGMGVWNVATALPQVLAPLLAAPLVEALDARAPGLGPRGAIVLALIEFAAGAAAVWRLPRV